MLPGNATLRVHAKVISGPACLCSKVFSVIQAIQGDGLPDPMYYFARAKNLRHSMYFSLQLVCFYYVLTTFTTVGYGEWDSVIRYTCHGQLISDSFASGDIFATTEGERVRTYI